MKSCPVPFAIQDDLARAHGAGIARGVWTSGGFRGGGWGGCIPSTSLNITCICIILNIKKKAISEYSIGRVTAI